MARRGEQGDRSHGGRRPGSADRKAGGAVASADPFGAAPAEALWRRFAGSGVATLMMVAALSWWVPLVPLVLCALLYLVGIPVSVLMERRWPVREGRSPVLRYVVLGALVGLGVAVGLATPAGLARRLTLQWVMIFAVFTVPAGALAGGTAAWSSRALPDRWVRATALAGPILAVAITLAVMVTRGI